MAREAERIIYVDADSLVERAPDKWSFSGLFSRKTHLNMVISAEKIIAKISMIFPGAFKIQLTYSLKEPDIETVNFVKTIFLKNHITVNEDICSMLDVEKNILAAHPMPYINSMWLNIHFNEDDSPTERCSIKK
jgi:hypothetical protein